MRIAVTGASGQLGASLARALGAHEAILLGRDALDVTDPESCRAVLGAIEPDRVIHAKAWTDVDACEGDPERAQRVNADGARNVASATDAFVVVVSTDYVFDGDSLRAYVETDATNPLQVYGSSKLAGERAALEAAPARCAVARTAWLYGATTATGESARNFVTSILRASAQGPLDVVDDQVGSPTCTEDLARALVTLCERAVAGTFHVVNAGVVDRAGFARAIVRSAGGDPAIVRGVATADAPARPARRPLYAPLEGAAWRAAGFAPLPSWEDALARTMPDILSAL